MRVSDHMSADHVFLNAPVRDKEEVLSFVAGFFAKNGIASDEKLVYACMVDREGVMTTGIGAGIGIPHAACEAVIKPSVVVLRPETPVEFDALDSLPVDVVIAMVVPLRQKSIHLRLLAGIARLIKKQDFVQAVRQASSPDDLFATMQAIEDSMAFH